MTVPVQTPVTSTEANGVTTVFPYGFKITDADDLRVSVNDVVVTSGFSISGVGNESGGSVTFSVAPSNHSIVVCELDSQLKRDSDFQQFGDWIAGVVNNEFDRIWLALQSLKQFMSRAVMIRLSSILEDFNSELPPPVAGAVIGWNSSKNGFVNVSPEYVMSLVDSNGNVTFPYGLGFSGHAVWADWSTSVGMYGSGNYFQRLVGAKTSVCTIPPRSGPGPTYESEFVAFGGLPLPAVMDVPYVAMRADGNAGAPMRTISGRSGSMTPYRAYAINTYGSDKFVVAADTTGTYTFGGTAPRILADLSNATLVNRMMFQSSTVNGATDVGVTPNGTSTTAGFTAYNAADPTNASTTTLQTTSTQSKLIAGKAGSGSYKPLVLNVNGVDAFQLDTSGNSLHTNPAGGLGYGAGAGGTVTQTTSKSTEVTLNRPCGRITMHNQTLAGGGEVQFKINNWLIAASDFPEVQSLWSGVYWTRVVAWGDGYADVVLKNTTGAPYSDNVQIYFNLKKGSFV